MGLDFCHLGLLIQDSGGSAETDDPGYVVSQMKINDARK